MVLASQSIHLTTQIHLTTLGENLRIIYYSQFGTSSNATVYNSQAGWATGRQGLKEIR